VNNHDKAWNGKVLNILTQPQPPNWIKHQGARRWTVTTYKQFSFSETISLFWLVVFNSCFFPVIVSWEFPTYRATPQINPNHPIDGFSLAKTMGFHDI